MRFLVNHRSSLCNGKLTSLSSVHTCQVQPKLPEIAPGEFVVDSWNRDQVRVVILICRYSVAKTKPPREFIYVRIGNNVPIRPEIYLSDDDVTVVRYGISVENGIQIRQVKRAMLPKIHLCLKLDCTRTSDLKKSVCYRYHSWPIIV